jgi:hypothetical protein
MCHLEQILRRVRDLLRQVHGIAQGLNVLVCRL